MESWKRVIKEMLLITDYLCVGLKVTLISYKNIELKENSYIVDFRTQISHVKKWDLFF